MCILAWNWRPGSDLPLLLLGNRDEWYARPTQALHWWDVAKGIEANTTHRILAGRDLEAGGTWLGLSSNGRLAALTNIRSPEVLQTEAPSRGLLVAGFLQSTDSASAYLQTLQLQAADYKPFNLLVYDGETLQGFHSATGHIRPLQPGLGAVSNADFETPWPKLVKLRQGLQQQVAQNNLQTGTLLALLQDGQVADDAGLPHTGISLEWERALSATRIHTPAYGTRASSVVKMATQHIEFTEVSYDASGVLGTHTETFSVRQATRS
ncbi:MAG: hypothetical protein CFE43_20475 [Burkholderiales bacterium PBB3]|nr:MAG: hypothetical protein CFE43_20475 [Burkholderiales bacterium PBB3]